MEVHIILVFVIHAFRECLTEIVRSDALCPGKCTCDVENDNSFLTVNCNDRLTSDYNENNTLTWELDRLLLEMDNLIHFEIHNSSLKSVPLGLCNKAKLQYLNLHFNQIERLPSHCFTQMKDLREFRADHNFITSLQDGLFDGLMKLEVISLSSNKINWIDPRLLSNSSDLLRLRDINLNYNLMTSLDSWIFIRTEALAGAQMTISIYENLIESFTNTLNWTYNCNQKRGLRLGVDLGENRMSHLGDVFSNLNLTPTLFSCLYHLNDLRFVIKGNPFSCDCLDFNLIAGERVKYGESRIEEARCEQPIELHGSRIVSVPLEKLICKAQTQCPKKCECFYQPSSSTFHVLCPSIGLDEFPVELPPLNLFRSLFTPTKKPKYKLNFSGNNITIVPARNYFEDTVSLDVSNCNLSNITDEALQLMLNIKYIYLNGNLLRTLPPVIKTLNSSFTFLNLNQNPWICTCEEVWEKTWLHSVYGRLHNPDAIQCDYPEKLKGMALLIMNNTDLCTENIATESKSFDYKIIIVSILIVALIFLTLTVIYKSRRREPDGPVDDPDSDDDNDMLFDVFIAFAQSSRPVALDILKYLETEPNSYRVCFHERDFRPGEYILDNIITAIYNSKRVLCLLSDDFLNSPYCVEEFEMALNRNIQENRNILIVLLLDTCSIYNDNNNNPPISEDESEVVRLLNEEAGFNLRRLTRVDLLHASGHIARVKNFMERHTYIEQQSNDWMQKILLAMPKVKTRNEERQ